MALAQLARAYLEKGDIESAIEPAIDSYMLDQIDWVEDMFDVFKGEAPELFVARLKIALVEYPNKEDVIKDFLMRVYYWNLDDYHNAIKYAEDLNKMYPDYLTPYTILALSHIELGEYDKALCDLDTLVKRDTLDITAHYLYHRAYYGQGLLDKSLESINEAIALDPEVADFYQLRGKLYYYMGRIDDAIDDYSMAITLDPTESYYLLNRGVLLQQKNKKIAAEEDFNKVIELESGRDVRLAFAYFYLGDSAKALEILVEGYAEKEIDDYNAACLYSLMGQKEMALRYLERSLDGGFRNFVHIDLDKDFDNIRDLPEFKALIERYKNQH
jgi:tetratricopeptide (TPR) repeat protein